MSLKILGYSNTGDSYGQGYDARGDKYTDGYDAAGSKFTSSGDLVELSTTDGAANTAKINALLEEGDVVLAAGDYPVAPGILVNGRTLDLNGAHLTSTELRFTGALIGMQGNSPCVKNGWLSGLYYAAPGEEGYVRFEGESAIRFRQGGISNAVISGLKINNFCGFSVVNGQSDQLTEVSYKKTTTQNKTLVDGEFIVPSLSDEYPYITARHAIGYNYYISDEPVRYKFFDKNGELLATKHGIPGESILKPTGAVSVSVYVTIEKFVDYGVFEYKRDNSIRIENCEFYCNQRLAIANLPGFSEVINCQSRSNGYPREDHTGISWDSDTSGFIDIEDIQTPYLLIENCSSENENGGIFSRVYDLEVINSPAVKTSLRKGWKARVIDSGYVSFYNPDTAFEIDVTIGGTTQYYPRFALDSKDRTGKNLGDKHLIPATRFTYDGCVYDNLTTGILWYGSRSEGAFKNCTFNLGADWMLSRGTFNLTFTNCTINTNGHYLVEHKQNNSSSLTFVDCTIDDTSKLTTGTPVTVTIENSGGTS